MAEYIFLMHDDADDEGSWESYLQALKENGSFEGGSAIGDGVCVRKRGRAPSVTTHLTGYIRVEADSIEHAKALVAGNPHFEGGRHGRNTRVAADELIPLRPQILPVRALSKLAGACASNRQLSAPL